MLRQKDNVMLYLLGIMAVTIALGVRAAGKGNDTLFPATLVAFLAIPITVFVIYFARKLMPGAGEVGIAGVHCAGVFTIVAHLFCAMYKGMPTVR